MKKYLIRVIGALCILGAVALMLFPGWVQMNDVNRRELRDLRQDITGMFSAVEDGLTDKVENDSFKDELKDYDLPYNRNKIKSYFKKLNALTEELLNTDISLEELLTLSMKAPGLLKDAENMLDSRVANVFFEEAAFYVLYEGSEAIGTWSDYDEEDVQITETILEDTAQGLVDYADELKLVCYLLTGVLLLLVLLGVASAVTHVCNKGRWLKYVFLVILVALVAGTCVALPMVTEIAAESLQETPAFADMTLGITVAPFFAVALMIVPVVLDIIFAQNKVTKKVEE